MPPHRIAHPYLSRTYHNYRGNIINESGGAGEFHPHAPTVPYVTVSRHPALIILPPN